eukprot:TRINITY_DN2733_c0_g2_i1.p1 TRINITY_DN2733_c0_g2~~TRINITY_DN2733_c0_g2_i1.p1  ORF type:complete len:962 (-),score=174.82 TRINITY_DN2733_c0_g2_i1:25-2874(-)
MAFHRCLSVVVVLHTFLGAFGITVDTGSNGFLAANDSKGDSLLNRLDAKLYLMGDELRSVTQDFLDAEEQLILHPSSFAQVVAPKGGEYFRPVSCTLQCVMALTIVSLIVYTSLSLARNYDELNGEFKPSVPTQSLTVAGRTAMFMPMMCMLFVACRMYVLATTEGLGEPQDWVKGCMRAATVGVILQVLIPLLLPAAVRKIGQEDAAYDMTEGKAAAAAMKKEAASQKKKGDAEAPSPLEGQEEGNEEMHVLAGDQNDVHPILHNQRFEDHDTAKPIFYSMQVVSLLCLYIGVAGVVVGIFVFPAQSTKISPAVLCTICLSVIYFSTYLLLHVARTMEESPVQQQMLHAAFAMTSCVRKAPMFAVFFLVSRMRALQLNPPYGMPPVWMQCCFFAITAGLYIEVLAAAVVGATGKQYKGYYGVYLYTSESPVMHVVQHTCAIVTYFGLFPCVYGVYQMRDMAGVWGEVGAVAPLSTTMKCVIVFSAVYFAVALGQTVALILQDVLKKHGEYTDMLRDTFVSAGISLGLAPMLCVLFVATRMRALQITQQMGAPPGWAQDCMLIAVFATCVQAFCCLVMPIFIGSACKVDEDGNPDYDLQPMIGAYAVTVVKYVALLALHGSVITVCVAVYVMTPETAHSGGRFIGSTKQLFEGLGVTCLVFAIALLFSSAKVIGMAVKFAVESCDEHLLGVDITIKSAALSIFKGYVSINQFKLHPPKEEKTFWRDSDGKLQSKLTGRECEWEADYIMKIRTIMVKLNLWRLFTSMGKEFEIENLSICGVHLKIEKPTKSLSDMNSNIEYVLNFIEELGLMPVEEPKSAAKEEEKAPEPTTEETEPAEPIDIDIPKIIVGKIQLLDIGAGVIIRGIPAIKRIAFHPTIGGFAFEHVQKEVFGGKEDLTPGQTIACIISAVSKKLFKSVAQGIPGQVAKAAKGAVTGAVRGLASGCACSK